MQYDKRLIKVSADHPQRRVSKPRIGVVARGIDFIEGDLTNMWVSPITGVLQSTPNSEESEYQTTNSGRWTKFGLSDTVGIDENTPAGEWKMMAAAGMHADSAFSFVGENTAGVGRITSAAMPANTGQNLAQFCYGSGLDQDGILCEFGWNDDALVATGESVRIYLDGRCEVWRDNVLQGKGAFSGGEYSFGTVRGGSYERASNEFVSIRAEVTRDRYLTITSSKGGVFQFAAPWAVDRYDEAGEIVASAAPVVRSSKLWFRIPQGGAAVVWSKVQYAPPGSAISELFALSEEPGATPGAFSSKALPLSSTVSVAAVAPNGVDAFDTNTNRCRIKVVSSTSPVWIDGASIRWSPKTKMTTGAEGGTDITEWLRSSPSFHVEDGPEGAVVNLEIALAVLRDVDGTPTSVPLPISGVEEIEYRPFLIELVAHPDDPDAPASLILLDGVGGAPEYVDGWDGQAYVKIEVRDRLSLLKDAETTEVVVFDQSYLCRPISSGDSFVAACGRQAGLVDSEMDLPDIDFQFEHVPPQKAGDWSFSSMPGDRWWDVLAKGMDFAPSLIWGIRPTATGPNLYVIDPAVTTSVKGKLYRTPEAADADGAAEDSNLGAFPALYDEHTRRKLPIEGNLVRVLGLDPATQKPITTYRSDDASRDPTSTPDGRWLGVTRSIKFESASLTSQVMVDRVADSLAAAVQQRDYVEPWRSFMLCDDDGIPLWRGDMVRLVAALVDGTDSDIRISSLIPEMVDEHGNGLMDDTGRLAPVSIRLCNYTGGALIGLGGAGMHALVARHKKRLENGGWSGPGKDRIPKVSPFSAVVKAL